MRHVAFAVLLLVAGPASAQSAKVISGDHDDFSRLVVELPAASDWQVGRTSDGYALAVNDAPDGYDLSGVFDLIRRDRLAMVSVDAQTGNLQLGLACACHVIPFEFRPGVIVIDIRDGAPPEGSSFELPLDTRAKAVATPEADPAAADDSAGATAIAKADPDPPEVAQDAAPARPSPWVFSTPPVADRFPDASADKEQDLGQWPALKDALAAGVEMGPVTPRNLSAPTAPMASLRDDLLMQISRGAARGVVDLAPAAPRSQEADTNPGSAGFAQVAIDPIAGMSATTIDDPASSLTPEGANCIGDDRLGIVDWGRDGPVAAQVSALTAGIVGEFDAVNPDALAKAVKLALHLGFGVEAGRMIEVFPAAELAAEAPVWASMGRIIDGYPDPTGAFADMQTCDSAAALWAVLAVEHVLGGDQTNTDAVLRSFSALPLHLRLALGPSLAQKFLEVDRSDVAQAIGGAIARAPEGAGHEADLISAKLDMASGDHEDAAALAQEVIDDAGPAVPEAMLALVGAALAQDKPVDNETTDALAAIVRENQGAPLEGDLTEMLILALASQGNADAAFALLPKQPQIQGELWRVLAAMGTDDDLLKHAVLEPDAVPAEVSPDTRTKLAERLRGLGFTPEAMLWQDATGVTRPPIDEAVAAPPADPEVAARDRDRILARDWNALAEEGAPAWQNAARHAASKAPAAAGLTPLAEAASLLEDAATARADISALLSAINLPAVESGQSP